MTNEKLDKLAKVIRKYSVRVSAPYPDDDCFYYLTTENQLKKGGINIGTYKKYFYVYLNKVYNYPYDKSLLWYNSEFLNSISKNSHAYQSLYL
jgi:hypothetical protein